MSDNTTFDMTDVPLKPALEIAFSTSPSGKATHWKHDKQGNKIVLAWNEKAGKDFVPFIQPLTAAAMLSTMLDGIEQMLDYGVEPAIDGDSDKSFRIYCEDWGFIDHNHYTFCAIEPAWAMYGK